MFARLLQSGRQYLRRNSIPLFLLGLSIAAYGLTVPWQGLYWDDWGIAYITRFVGPQGFFDWNAVSRPLRAYFDLLFSYILGVNPFAWQVFGLLSRWALALAFQRLFIRLWPGRERAALIAACLLLVYPGFRQQFLPLTNSYFWLVGILFCLSLLLTLRAVHAGRVSWPLLLVSAALAGLQQFLLEYLFGLEVLRFFLLWRESRGTPRRGLRFLATALPFMLALGAYVYWRIFVFTGGHYRVTLWPASGSGIAAAILSMLGELAVFAYRAGPLAWAQAFTFPFLETLTGGQRWLLAGVMLLVLASARFFLRRSASAGPPERKHALAWIGLGLLLLLAAGLPFTAGGLDVSLSFPEDRLTYPYVFGAAFLLTGLWELVADASTRAISISILLAAAVGLQFQYACFFLEQKQLQRDFIWQLTWRAPGLRTATALLSDDAATFADDDEALTYLLNWTYAPEQRGGDLPYVLYMLSANFDQPEELFSLPSLRQEFYAAAYEGNTEDVLVIRYAPPACLRVLDPRYDADLIQVTFDADQAWRREATVARALPSFTSAVLAWSNPSRVLLFPDAPAQPPVEYVGAEPERGWCYYFERADLARQQEDWALATALGDQALAVPHLPVDYSEGLLFVEAYARVGRWDQALALAAWSLERAPALEPAVCDILQRLSAERDPARARSFAAQLGICIGIP